MHYKSVDSIVFYIYMKDFVCTCVVYIYIKERKRERERVM